MAGTEAVESYYRSLPEMTWNYETTSAAFTSSVLMYRVLRAWAFADRYGFKVHDVVYRGKPLTARQIERCNLWIQAGGATQAAKLEHWEAVRVFEKIIQGVAEVDPGHL